MLLELDKEKIIIMIPALNPSHQFIKYIDELIDNNFRNIIVINDGSATEFNTIFEAIKEKNIIVIEHEKNLGKGKAIKSGLEYLQSNDAYNDCLGVITVDSDGQHLLKDVINVANSLKENKDSLILGCRDFESNNVPPKSKFGNKTTSNFFKLLYGVKISDTQTGLRGISKNLFNQLINLEGDRFEYETNMLIDCILKKVNIVEVQIETVYMNNNKETHFRPFKDSVLIYWRILNSFFKYSLVSVISCIIDLTLFQILLLTLPIKNSKTILIVISTVIARVISSLVNYTLNKKVSFNSKNNVKNTILKYYALCIIQIIVSSTLVSILCNFIGIPEILVKIVVDTIIFIVNYRVQRLFIFNR